MDISTIRHLTFDFFRSEDKFDPAVDFRKIKWQMFDETKDLKDEDLKLGLEIVLQEMLESDFIKMIETGAGKNKKKIYFIVNSLKNEGTSIDISPQTAQNIKKLCQSLIPMLDLEGEYNMDSIDVSEEEVVLVLEAISIISNQLTEKLKECEDKDKLITELKKNQKPPE